MWTLSYTYAGPALNRAREADREKSEDERPSVSLHRLSGLATEVPWHAERRPPVWRVRGSRKPGLACLIAIRRFRLPTSEETLDRGRNQTRASFLQVAPRRMRFASGMWLPPRRGRRTGCPERRRSVLRPKDRDPSIAARGYGCGWRDGGREDGGAAIAAGASFASATTRTLLFMPPGVRPMLPGCVSPGQPIAAGECDAVQHPAKASNLGLPWLVGRNGRSRSIFSSVSRHGLLVAAFLRRPESDRSIAINASWLRRAGHGWHSVVSRSHRRAAAAYRSHLQH